MESKRRDNPLFAAKGLGQLLSMMLVDGASNAELEVFARSIMAALLADEIPLAGLVMSQCISKPLHEYKGAQAHVNVARALIAAGHPVATGDRVKMIFLCADKGSGRSEKAYPAKLFDPLKHAIDFGFYTRYISGPFDRALEFSLSKETRASLWDLTTYDCHVPSRTSGNYGPMARYLTLAPRVYEVRKRTSLTAKLPDTTRPLKQVKWA